MSAAFQFPEYPFESHYMELEAGRLHYLDEGDGPTVLFLHGNPTWSFYYRHCILGLRDRYRCIAPDLLGFGLSSHPGKHEFGFTPADHAATIDTFLERLGIERYHLVVHEWGGPIGIDCASRSPQRLGAVVAMNSWFWPVSTERRFRRSSYGGSGLGGGYLSSLLNLPIETMFSRHGRSSVSSEVLEAYRAAQREPEGREGIRVFKREIVRASRWLQAVRDRQPRISSHPLLLLWAGGDHVFTADELRMWEVLFQHTETVRFADAGRYIAEELGPQLVPYIADFLQRHA